MSDTPTGGQPQDDPASVITGGDGVEYVTVSVLQDKIMTELTRGNQDAAVELLKQAPVEKSFGENLLNVSVIKNSETVIRFLLESKKAAPEKEFLSAIHATASTRHYTNLALYLSEKLTDLGESRVSLWEIIFKEGLPQDHELIVRRIHATATDKKSALDDMFCAAVLAGSYGVLPELLDLGADPNAGNGMALVYIVSNPLRSYYNDLSSYKNLLQKMFDKGYAEMQLVDDMTVVALQKCIAGEQRGETAVLLLKNGADLFANACEAQKTIVGHFAARGDDFNERLWNSFFEGPQADSVKTERRRFEGFFGAEYRLFDLLQTLERGDTGLMIAARARMLAEVLQKFSAAEKSQLTVEDLTAKNDRQQSVMTLAADRGDLKQLLAPTHWPSREKEILAAVFENLSPPRLALGGYENLQAAHTRDRIVSTLDRKRWQLKK